MIKGYKIQKNNNPTVRLAIISLCFMLQACASQPKHPVQTEAFTAQSPQASITLDAEAGVAAAQNDTQDGQMAQTPQTLRKQDESSADQALADMKHRLDSINHSPAHKVSALSYMKGNFGRNIDVFPLNEPIDNPPVLKPRGQAYPRHTLQAGQNIFTPEQNPSVIVYPYDPSAKAISAPQVQEQEHELGEAQKQRFLTQPDLNMNTAENTSPVAVEQNREDRRPNRTARRLTGYE